MGIDADNSAKNCIRFLKNPCDIVYAVKSPKGIPPVQKIVMSVVRFHTERAYHKTHINPLDRAGMLSHL